MNTTHTDCAWCNGHREWREPCHESENAAVATTDPQPHDLLRREHVAAWLRELAQQPEWAGTSRGLTDVAAFLEGTL